MYIKTDIDEVFGMAEKRILKTNRKAEIARLNEIKDMCAVARRNLCVYCSLEEGDFKLLFMED